MAAMIAIRVSSVVIRVSRPVWSTYSERMPRRSASTWSAEWVIDER